MITQPLAAPSATPAPAPALAAPSSPAPSAAPAPVTLADYAALARASLAGPPTSPANAPGPESPPAANADPSLTPPADPAAAVPPTSPDDSEEPTPEAQSLWSEGERRLYGALRKEREARKDARKEVSALKEQLDTLAAKLTAPVTPPPAADAPATPAPEPRSAGLLADCVSFDQVDARVMQAATVESQALRLQTTLARAGREPVVAALSRSGLKEIDGTPLESTSDEQLGDFIGNLYEGARQTTLAAEPRKRFLVQQAQSFEKAVEILPEIKDPKSPRAQRFSQILQANPWLRSQGPNWPEMAAKYLLGDEASAKPAKATAPAHAAPAPAPIAQAPGAPARSPAALPKVDEYEQAAARIANGSATMDDIKLMARLATRASAAR